VNRLRSFFYLIAATSIILMTVGCSNPGGSDPNPPATISVTLSSQRVSTMEVGTSTTISANVNNDALSGGVNWTVSCSTSSCGSFNPTKTASAANTTYTAPSTVPGTGVLTVTATSVSDPTKSATASITVTTGPAISVTLSTPPPASVVTAATANIVASVTGDSVNGGVTRSVTCGSSQCGSFNPTKTASGAATTYTAPATAPSGNAVTIQATSVTDSAKSVSANVTITTPAPSAFADGTYIYNISGQDNNGSYFVVGAFAVKSGAITGGEQDFADPGSSYTDNFNASNSTITTSNGSTLISLATGNSNIGIGGTELLHGTMISGSRLLITQFDTFASATGSIDLQTSTTQPSGGYAFMVNGSDDGTPVNQLAIGGVLNFSTGTLSPAGSVFDVNDGGDLGQAQGFGSGSVSTPDTYGRVMFNLAPNSSSKFPGFILTGYIIGNKIQLIENQNDALNGVVGGVALGQGSNTGKFNSNSPMVSGQSYAYGLSGEDSNGLLTMAGGFALNSDGTVGGRLAFNDIANHNGNSITGTYTVDPTGRVTLNNVATSNLNVVFTFQLYLDGNGNALSIGVDDLEASGGLAYLQQAPGSDYEGSYALSAQGFLNQEGAPALAAVGPININSDNMTGTTDYTAQGYNPAINVQFTGLENESPGLWIMQGLNIVSFSGSSSYAEYPIDANRILLMSIGQDQLGLMLEGITVSR
jgi:hypothetical protein